MASPRETFVRSIHQNNGEKIQLYDVACVSELNVLPSLNTDDVECENNKIFETTETLLKPNTPAKILNKPDNIAAKSGSRVVLEIEYTGLPEPDVVWYKAVGIYNI